MRYLLILILAACLVALVVSVSCDKKNPSYLTKYITDDNPFTDDEARGCSGIPPDPSFSESDIMSDIKPENKKIIPSAGVGLVEGTSRCVQINISGLINPNTGDPFTPIPNKNIFIVEDGKPQGFTLVKVDESSVALADVVFTIDNSGSMYEEADAIAAGIIAFAKELETTGLDIRFGCVGYWGNVSGAINLTSAEKLEEYLNRNGVTGTSRTVGFSGPDSADLMAAAPFFGPGGGENGVDAIFFADSVFSWRSGAQRHFINFTDEPTQPNGDSVYSTDAMCADVAGRAAVHSVFSSDTGWAESPLVSEHPWRMAECTGGTQVFVAPDASDLDLSQLPIVGFLSNSYIIQFTSSDGEAVHNLKIYIFDEGADGVIEFAEIIYSGP